MKGGREGWGGTSNTTGEQTAGKIGGTKHVRGKVGPCNAPPAPTWQRRAPGLTPPRPGPYHQRGFRACRGPAGLQLTTTPMRLDVFTTHTAPTPPAARTGLTGLIHKCATAVVCDSGAGVPYRETTARLSTSRTFKERRSAQHRAAPAGGAPAKWGSGPTQFHRRCARASARAAHAHTITRPAQGVPYAAFASVNTGLPRGGAAGARGGCASGAPAAAAACASPPPAAAAAAPSAAGGGSGCGGAAACR